MNIEPLGTRVIVEPKEKEKKTKGGIYLPDTAQEKENIGTVVAVSKGIKESPVSQGDTVMFEKYGGKEISDNEKKYIIIDVKDIIARLS
ncbi:MAG: co-chaperone GroES [Nanoarchaeota archaeon]